MNLFRLSNKVSSYEKLLYKSGVCFLILFVLMDATLINLDLQKRPPLMVRSDLVELIDIHHIFLKHVALV